MTYQDEPRFVQNRDSEVKTVNDIVKESNVIQVEVSNYNSSQLDNKFVLDLCYVSTQGSPMIYDKELIGNDETFQDLLTKMENKAKDVFLNDALIIEKVGQIFKINNIQPG